MHPPPLLLHLPQGNCPLKAASQIIDTYSTILAVVAQQEL